MHAARLTALADPKVLMEVSENLGEAMVGIGAIQEDDTSFRERGD